MTTPIDLGYRLLLAVGRINRWASHRSHFTVSTAQLRTLALADQLAPARVGELAAADHCTQPSMTAALNRTDAAGWTTRSPDPRDGRAQVVTLTDAGRAVLAEARTTRAETLRQVLSEMSGDELARLTTALRALDDLVARLDDASSHLTGSNSRAARPDHGSPRRREHPTTERTHA